MPLQSDVVTGLSLTRIGTGLVWTLAVVLASAGCGDSRQNRLHGTWLMSAVDQMAERIPSQNQPVQGTETAASPQMELVFTVNGQWSTRTVINSIRSEKSGTWQWQGATDRPQTFLVKFASELQTSETEIEFVDVNTIKLTPPNLAGLPTRYVFRRQ